LTPDTHIYLCGPKGMIDAARTAAVSEGHPEDQIHIELFTSAATAEGDTAFEVEIADTGAVYTIPPGKTIIDVLEDEGMDLIYDCQRGDCGICQTDVISGTPDHRDVVLSDAEKASGKVMQICVSRAKSDRLVLDL
jgi:vanillate O-demethylase ferredoxin subunit